MKFNEVERTIYYVTLSCGERYVALPSVRPCKGKPYDVFFACEDGDLLYVTSLRASQILSYFFELENDFR